MVKGLLVCAAAGGIAGAIVGVWVAAAIGNAVKFVYGGV